MFFKYIVYCSIFVIILGIFYLSLPVQTYSQTDKISIFEVINSSYYISGDMNKIDIQKTNISDAISNLILNHIITLDQGVQNTTGTNTNEFTIMSNYNSSEISHSSIKMIFDEMLNESLSKINLTDTSQNAVKVGPFPIWRCNDNQTMSNWTCLLP